MELSRGKLSICEEKVTEKPFNKPCIIIDFKHHITIYVCMCMCMDFAYSNNLYGNLPIHKAFSQLAEANELHWKEVYHMFGQ